MLDKMLTKINALLDKAINKCLSTQTELNRFSDRTKAEILNYRNKHVKKAGCVCLAVGFILGFIVKAVIF